MARSLLISLGLLLGALLLLDAGRPDATTPPGTGAAGRGGAVPDVESGPALVAPGATPGGPGATEASAGRTRVAPTEAAPRAARVGTAARSDSGLWSRRLRVVDRHGRDVLGLPRRAFVAVDPTGSPVEIGVWGLTESPHRLTALGVEGPVLLTVYGGDHGRGTLRLEALDGDDDDPPLEVRLLGSGRVQGTVVDQLGNGIGRRLVAAAASGFDPPPVRASLSLEDIDREVEPIPRHGVLTPAGYAWRRGRTDDSGAFALAGLEAGRVYDLHVQSARIGGEPGPWVHVGSVLALEHPQPTRFTFPGAVLEVIAPDEDAGPAHFHCTVYDLGALSDPRPPGDRPWPTPCWHGGDGIIDGGPQRRHSIPLAPGRRYALVPRWDGAEERPIEFELGAPPCHERVVLGPPSEEPLATLWVTLTWDDPRPEAQEPDPPVALVVFDASRGLHVATEGNMIGSSRIAHGRPVSFTLRAGEVTVLAVGSETLHAADDSLSIPGRHGHAREHALLVPGETTDVALHLHLVGHLRVRCAPPRGDEVVTPLRLTLLPDGGGRPVKVLRPVSSLDERLDGTQVEFTPGTEATSVALPTGTFVLEATAPGRPPWRRTVTLRPGEVTEVEIEPGQ